MDGKNLIINIMFYWFMIDALFLYTSNRYRTVRIDYLKAKETDIFKPISVFLKKVFNKVIDKLP